MPSIYVALIHYPVVNKSGDVKKTELLERNALGGFTEDVYNAVRTDDRLFGGIVKELLNDLRGFITSKPGAFIFCRSFPEKTSEVFAV